MKYLFGLDRRTKTFRFDKFIIRTISNERQQKLDDTVKEGKALKKDKTVPGWVLYIAAILMMTGLAFVIGLFNAKDGFQHALETRGYMLFVGIAAFLAGAILFTFFIVVNKNVKKDPEVNEFMTNAEKTIKEALTELNVPDNHLNVDVLFVSVHENKKGNDTLDNIAFLPFINQELFLFIENDMLCFADASTVIGIPLNSIGEIKEIKKSVGLARWNKPQKINSEEYKRYKLRYSQTALWAKSYYSVSLNINGEEYYFYLPPYEFEAFKKLIEINNEKEN